MSNSNEKNFSTAEVRAELKRVRNNNRFFRALKNTVFTLVTVSALAILVATLFLPVLRIYGNSMTPTLNAGDLVVSLKSSDFKPGDVVAFYYGNKILVKRVIAGPGDWVDISDNGTVFVNGQALDEPYLDEKSLGQTDIEYPYQVGEDRWFVMGDHRDVSLDSRSRAIGDVAQEQIVGKLVFRIWPPNALTKL